MGDFDTVWEDLPSTDTPITAAYLSAVDKALRSLRPAFRFDLVEDGGAQPGTGVDATAAVQAALDACAAHGGGVIYSSQPGMCTIAGPLQDTGGANAQLLLPAIDYVDSEQITIMIEGTWAPPPTFSVIGATPLPDNNLGFKSTLTSGSGGAMLGAQGPSGTYQSFTNVHLVMRNLSGRMPSNPTHSCFDLSKVASVDLDGVIVDASSYDIDGLVQPTTSTSYGIKLPKLNNGAYTRLGSVYALGFYKGIQCNEHTNGQQVTVGGCKVGVEFTAAYHASKFERLMVIHCQKGIVATGGTHVVDIDQYDIEHIGTGWNATTADVDDPSNYLKGTAHWHVVLGTVGIDSTFTKTGGSNFHCYQVGTPAGSSLTVQDENSNIATGVTQIDFQGAGVVASSGSGEVVVTIAGATGTSKELLMQDGVTAPPVPLETEARSDWLYQD